MSKDKEIITRVVLVEKCPFYISILGPPGTEDEIYYSGKILVRPCVNEDDLIEARDEYEKNAIEARQQGDCKRYNLYKSRLSYNPNNYYFVLSGENFIGNIVNKSICKRIINNKAVTNCQ